MGASDTESVLHFMWEPLAEAALLLVEFIINSHEEQAWAVRSLSTEPKVLG